MAPGATRAPRRLGLLRRALPDGGACQNTSNQSAVIALLCNMLARTLALNQSELLALALQRFARTF
eukprot:13705898-Alexandrium_andersonii.AAC.1